MTAPARSTNPEDVSEKLCPDCHGAGVAPGGFFLHDVSFCESCGGSGLAKDVQPVPATLHPDTAKLIDEFCAELKRKAFAAQVKYGFSNNWKSDHWQDDLKRQIRQHIEKGDPRDVALYSAFAWGRGWRLCDEATSAPAMSA